MEDITIFTDEQIQKEMVRRASVAAAKVVEARQRRLKLVLTHRDVLLELMTHSRRSCVEGRAVNGSDCNKCALIDLGDWSKVDVSIDVNLTWF